MSLPTDTERSESTRLYTFGALALLIVAAIATAASWHLYPMFIDTYYHMAVIEGFSQAGGIATRAFWEMAPGGRVHIYPPSLHVIGYFFSLLGVSTGTYMTWVSGTFYFGCLLTTWIWLRQIIGPRAALFALILLCGPSGFFWTQATFQAVAGVMVLAPLALLALEKERFLACGVLNFVAATMHPMGLFLPPALVINTLLRRKKIVSGLLAASVPVVLYGPWLAHIWANRALLPQNRTGGEISLNGPGGGANLGLLLAPLAAISVVWLISRRGPALGLVGALVGFAVVFPMGFGSRFLSFNVHWPLACLGGYGLGELVRWLDERARGRAAGQVFAFVVAIAGLVAYPAINLPLGGPGPGGGGGPRGPGGPPGTTDTRGQLQRAISEWRFTVQASTLPKLFDAYSGEGSGLGMGGPGPGGPGMGPGRPGMGPGGPGMGRGGFGMGPGGFGMGPGMGLGGPRQGAAAQRSGPGFSAAPGRPMGPGGGAGRSMPGMNLLTRSGAEEFFDAVRTNVALGDVIHMNDGAAANLIAGATGRWTSSGILRDVRSENGRTRPEECDFAVVLGGGMGMPGPGGPMGFQTLPAKFEKVFENDYGTLYRNPVKVEHARKPLKADVSLPHLAVMALVGFLLVLVDLLPLRRPRVRLVAAVAGTIAVALCLLPLASTAIGELRNPPSAPSGPGEGPPGFGGPGFGGPGFGPGQFLGAAFLREADTDRSGTVSLDEFKALAVRWFDAWDVNRKGHLTLEEMSQGLRSVLGPPPGMDGPMPMPGGPPGFGPEMFLATIFSACDANGDGKVTREEMAGAFVKWFHEWDEGAKGSLDAEALGKGMDNLVRF